MTRHRTDALTLVQRIEEQKMQAVARRLNDLVSSLRALDGDIAGLEARLDSAATTAGVEAAPHVGGFIRNIRQEIAARQKMRDEIAERARAVEAEIRGKFRRTRTLELSADALDARVRKSALRAQSARDLDQMVAQFTRDSSARA